MEIDLIFLFIGDTFTGMDWMSEKIDLADFDLDSLIGSCDLDEPPSSPEELLASLESQMDLDMASLPFSPTPNLVPEEIKLHPHPLEVPITESEAHLEPAPTEIKSEPESPSPAFTLELGSEVDIPISDIENAVTGTGSVEHQTPSIVLSLSSAQIVVVIAPKDELSFVSSSDQSDSGVDSHCDSPPCIQSPAPFSKSTGTSRAKPYSKPFFDAAIPAVGKVKSASGNSKGVEKKLKKMEQNKTAATRYRQKKRVEHEVLNTECAELEQRNKELAEKADSLSREIQYLKDLVEEVRSAKNRKNKAKAELP